jgi:hypothetical protein
MTKGKEGEMKGRRCPFTPKEEENVMDYARI